MLSVMCGRSTYKLTWEEIVALYRLTVDQPARNTQARYNVCPTTTIDTVVAHDGKRELVPMHLFVSLKEARDIIEEWRTDYNTNRPHSSLNGLTPTEFAARPSEGQNLL